MDNEDSIKLRYILNNLPTAYFAVDTGLKIIDRNKKFLDIFSFGEEVGFEDFTKKMGEVVDVRKIFEKVIKENKPEILEKVTFGGRFLKVSAIPVISDKNELYGVLCLIDDITSQVDAEQAKEDFFSIASHELKTPLTAIRGNASIIIDFFSNKLPNKDVENMVKDILEASLRLIKIINDFLDISKLEQKKVVFKKEEFDLGKVAEETLREFEASAFSKGLHLTIDDLSNKEFLVVGDYNRTKQIVSNLVLNALNYTKEGGVSLSLEKNGDFNAVLIKDTGVGMSEDDKGHIFKKFQQVGENANKSAVHGTGLGLYISVLNAESMKGKLELVSSELGKGSVFKLSMPVKI